MSSISCVCRRNSAKWRNSASSCDKISIAASRFRSRRFRTVLDARAIERD
jgi:hypothetical protein